MQNIHNSLKNALESKGLKSTTIRTQLHDLLISTSPISAGSFMNEAKSKGYDSVTIYRTLDIFKQLNLYDEYGYGKQRMLHIHNIDSSNHHHFIRCKVCNNAIEFENIQIEKQLDSIAKEQGFSNLSSHYLEITGICQYCRE